MTNDKNKPTKKEVREAKRLLGKNKKMIEDHFGSIEDALIWFHNCDIVNMAVVMNDLVNKFEQ